MAENTFLGFAVSFVGGGFGLGFIFFGLGCFFDIWSDILPSAWQRKAANALKLELGLKGMMDSVAECVIQAPPPLPPVLCMQFRSESPKCLGQPHRSLFRLQPLPNRSAGISSAFFFFPSFFLILLQFCGGIRSTKAVGKAWQITVLHQNLLLFSSV